MSAGGAERAGVAVEVAVGTDFVAVGRSLGVALSEAVRLGVLLGVAVAGEAGRVSVGNGSTSGEWLGEGGAVLVGERVRPMVGSDSAVGVAEATAPSVGVGDGCRVGVGDGGLLVGLGERPAVGVSVRFGVLVALAVGVAAGARVSVGIWVAEAVAVEVGVAWRVAVALAV